MAMKSGRPQHLHGVQQPQQWVGLEKPAHTSYHSLYSDLPTPPSSNFNTPPDVNAFADGLDMPNFMPANSFAGLNDVWMCNLDQETTRLPNSVAIPDGPLIPADLPNDHLRMIATLQTNLLADLDAVKHSRRVDEVPTQDLPSAADQHCNYLIGRTLHHSTVLLEIISYYDPTGQAASLDVDASEQRKGIHCDVPTMILLLSCYICLIRIYRTIFSTILESIPVIASLKAPAPQLFPGMNLGGFKLETRIDIQIQVLIQVSESFLAKLEAKFGLAKDMSASVFEHGRIARLAKVMLEEEAGEQPTLDQPRGSCESLRDILSSLKRVLQSDGVSNSG